MIQSVQRIVYRAPTKGRSYLTKEAAINAESRALISAKHPTEKPEYDSMGRITYGGWHWSEMERSDVLFRRVRRLVKKASA